MRVRLGIAIALAGVLASPPAGADIKNMKLEIYGFTWFDGGYDFNRVDPDWFDVVRPTKLPAFTDEFGEEGETWESVRPTRFGTKADLDTDYGHLFAIFEWELFGVGVNAGQTTLRLRHAYGELGQFGFGQYWSPFMDIDVFPNILEYWGPNGMTFFRNVQVRWMPIKGDTRVTIALERPGASADKGDFANTPELAGVIARFPIPDLSAEGQYGGDWGHVKLAGIVRRMEWDDVNNDAIDLSGGAWGWGLTASAVIKIMDTVTLRLQAVYGEGIENYMNDATVDVGVETTGDPSQPLEGEALPVLGLVAFADIKWSDQFASALGWSFVSIDNSNGQTADAFHQGQYALVNLLWMPLSEVMIGIEGNWGHRLNNSDDFDSNDFRIQLGAQFKFSATIGGEETK